MLKRSLIALIVLLVVVAATLHFRYGGGDEYPDLTQPARIPASQLESVVSYREPIGNVAVSGDGRIFFTAHPEAHPTGPLLLEWRDGKAVPYPSADAQPLFDTVLGVAIDRQNRLWTIDPGNHGSGKVRLLAFDLATGERVQDHVFSSGIAPLGSFLQDLQVAPDGQTVYIADVSFWRKQPALVVFDVASGKARRVLQGDPSVSPEDWIIQTPLKRMTFFGGLVALKAGVDGIALSRDGQWLYYGAMNNRRLFRIATAALRDESLSAAQLAARIEDMGQKPLNDGLSADDAGGVLITDVEHGAVMRLDPTTQTLTTLIKAPATIRWADALSFGPGNQLYIADSAIPYQMLQSRDFIKSHGPYYIWRVQTPYAGYPGQ